jgi:hypothetical protein
LADAESSKKEALTDAEVCTKAAQELKEMVDKLLDQVTPLEFQVQTLKSSVADHSAELRAKALSLDRTTTAQDNYQKKTLG